MLGFCKHDWDIVQETREVFTYKCPHKRTEVVEICRQCRKCDKHKEPDRGW